MAHSRTKLGTSNGYEIYESTNPGRAGASGMIRRKGIRVRNPNNDAIDPKVFRYLAGDEAAKTKAVTDAKSHAKTLISVKPK